MRLADALAFAAANIGLVVHAARLVTFQVAQPSIAPRDSKNCTLNVIRRTFGNSYGAPAIAQVNPPTDCGPLGSWAAVTLNLTVTSNGTQYDRLAIISYADVEVWRSSTPEPTRGDGIIWTHIKDVTKYTAIFQNPGALQLQLDNVLSDELGLDGQYDARLSITYHQSSADHPPAPKASAILRLTNFTSVPAPFTTRITFPRNTIKAFAELYASGNSNEEFWYFNTASKYVPELPPDTTYPNGPFREVRLLVDKQLAGVAFPYPVYFTGAITPNAWRPIAAYGALDQPTYPIDLTPLLPILTDGAAHTFTIDVLSAEDNHETNQNWWISGLIQIVVDDSPLPTTGNITVLETKEFAETATTGSVNSRNGDVNVTVSASRTLRIEADILSGGGVSTHVVWKQALKFSNTQSYLQNTTHQIVLQEAYGESVSTHNGIAAVKDIFNFPMEIDFGSTSDFQNFTAQFNHSYIRALLPSPFETGSNISSHQVASGVILRLPGGTRTGSGNSSNIFSYSDTRGNTYTRTVTAQLSNITRDEEGGSLAQISPGTSIYAEFLTSNAPVGRLPSGKLLD